MLQILVHLAAIDNAFLRTIDLEEEKHVVLINLAVIIALYQIIDCTINFY